MPRIHFALAAVAAVTALVLSNESRYTKTPLGADGFAIAAGLCVLAAALVRKDGRPEEPR